MFDSLDANNDGVITREEWGTLERNVIKSTVNPLLMAGILSALV